MANVSARLEEMTRGQLYEHIHKLESTILMARGFLQERQSNAAEVAELRSENAKLVDDLQWSEQGAVALNKRLEGYQYSHAMMMDRRDRKRMKA